MKTQNIHPSFYSFVHTPINPKYVKFISDAGHSSSFKNLYKTGLGRVVKSSILGAPTGNQTLNLKNSSSGSGCSKGD